MILGLLEAKQYFLSACFTFIFPWQEATSDSASESKKPKSILKKSDSESEKEPSKSVINQL